ncbi:MAG: 1-deoxy-D-xylulose-5-phosphate reductoisomerase [Firmicutes bacterium]|nr:1-deoxy-D-xylulose-5-phosphate reductoisomerase [Bacillota bacterium]
MKKIAILGSTGSIGTQALDVVSQRPEEFSVEALTCGSNIQRFRQQLAAFQPKLAVTAREEDAALLKQEFPHIDFLYGMDGIIAAASQTDAEMVLNSLMGMMGLVPTYRAIRAGKDIALANKETLVAGGSVIMNAVKEEGVQLLPVDSEHSAIFQCLEGNEAKELDKILLTASGGPFRGYTKEQLEHVTLEQALNHPRWVMGSKITIDSSTLMNKGLELIEAKWLFDVEPKQIQVVVHPESIIHSMVQYKDHSIIAQLGVPDMRIPIAYAFTYPHRWENASGEVDFFSLETLHFQRPDMETFRCLKLAFEAIETGGSCPVVMNAVNEVLVQQFLEGKIRYLDIPAGIERALERHDVVAAPSLEEILEIDRAAREAAAIRSRS